MSNFITFIRHDYTAALNLDFKKATEYILDLERVDFISFDTQYANGYGEKLSRLGIHIAGTEIVLYRDDALNLYQEIKEGKHEK